MILRAILLASILVTPVSVNQPQPHLSQDVWEPLGLVHVTRYTHHEGGRITSSGYILKDDDESAVCAVSRDWWRRRVMPGDMVFVEGFDKPCVALDTMAIKNRKGKIQERWVDIYMPDPIEALRFGIQRRQAWLSSRR